MPCVVNAGNVTALSDDEGNLDMTHARVDYVPYDDEKDVEITQAYLPWYGTWSTANHPGTGEEIIFQEIWE